MMRPNISNKLREIAAAIDRRGSANLTRLTVLKKWLEVSSHLSSFAIFIADQASRQKTKTTMEAAELFREAHTLLADVDVFAPKIPRAAATKLHASSGIPKRVGTHSGGRCASFMITNLFLVECGLHIYLGHGDTPTEGYRLATYYCGHYDPRYGNCLNGPSRRRIGEIVDFIQGVEDREEASV